SASVSLMSADSRSEEPGDSSSSTRDASSSSKGITRHLQIRNLQPNHIAEPGVSQSALSQPMPAGGHDFVCGTHGAAMLHSARMESPVARMPVSAVQELARRAGARIVYRRLRNRRADLTGVDVVGHTGAVAKHIDHPAVKAGIVVQISVFGNAGVLRSFQG